MLVNVIKYWEISLLLVNTEKYGSSTLKMVANKMEGVALSSCDRHIQSCTVLL